MNRSTPNRLMLLVAIVAAGGAPGMWAEEAIENGLGMRFVAVPGIEVRFSIYETRVKDYRAFVRETGYIHQRETADENSRMLTLDHDGQKQRGNSWENPGFAQTEDHPVVGVNWFDAKAFCEWLTLRERAAGRLPANREYRLPKDHEWSVAVGLVNENPLKRPNQNHGSDPRAYPWGEWPEGQPPPAGAGNYPGAETDDGHWAAQFPRIEGYRDDFPRTAPVGSFTPNRFGIYDLGGNVWEWCEDLHTAGKPERVLRGCSWLYGDRRHLLSSYRSMTLPGYRDDERGFRCVIAPGP